MNRSSVALDHDVYPVNTFNVSEQYHNIDSKS